MTPERKAEIRELLANATPGPWRVDYEQHKHYEWGTVEGPSCEVGWDPYTVPPEADQEADAKFIAAAPTIIAELLDWVEVNQALLESECCYHAKTQKERDQLKAEVEYKNAVIRGERMNHEADFAAEEFRANVAEHERDQLKAKVERLQSRGIEDLQHENRRLREALKSIADTFIEGESIDVPKLPEDGKALFAEASEMAETAIAALAGKAALASEEVG